MTSIPSSPGSYVLQLLLTQSVNLQIGRLGNFHFPAGSYLYSGSACGPGGLKARLQRHLQPTDTPHLHWHIDYLRAHGEPLWVWFLVHDRRAFKEHPLECRWSKLFGQLEGSEIPAPRFGASDCRLACFSHLYAFPMPTRQVSILSTPVYRHQIAAAAGLGEEMLCYIQLSPEVK